MGKEAKYVVRLTEDERKGLQELVATPRVARAKALRARMLLKADAEGPDWPDRQIAEAFEVSQSTVHRLREQFVEEGLQAALGRKPPSRTKPRRLDGAGEAHLVATACGPAPEGRTHWTLKLLADKLVELEIVDSISTETVRTTLKKTNSSRGVSSSTSFRRRPTPSLSARWRTR